MTTPQRQVEIKEGTMNVTPANMKGMVNVRSPKSLLNEWCHTRYRQPPTIETRTWYETRVTLPDGRVFTEQASVHSDSQKGACQRALQAKNDASNT